MNDSWQDSVVSITSSAGDNNSFGTGFVIHQDGQATYLLTCAHVVQDVGSEVIEINGIQAKVMASGSEESIDLAVLRVEGLPIKPSLPLSPTGDEGNPFSTAGFQKYGERLLIRELDGTLGKQGGLEMRGQADRIKAWDLKITDDYQLQPGYSGSPVVDKYRHVIGVVQARQGEGKKGLAISIDALKKIWQGMPPDLFKQDTDNHRAQAVSPPCTVEAGRSRLAILLKPMPQNRNFAEMTSVLFQEASKSSLYVIQQPQNRTVNTIISEWSDAARRDNPLILIFDFAADIEFALLTLARQLHGCWWVDGLGLFDASLATWKKEDRPAVDTDGWPVSVFLVDFSSVTPNHIFKQLSDSTEKTAPIAFEQRLSTFLSWMKSTHHHVVLGIPRYLLTNVDFAALQKQTDYLFLPEKLFSAMYVERVKQCEQLLRITMPFPDLLKPLVSANSSTLPIVLAQFLNERTRGRTVTEKDEHEVLSFLLDLAQHLTRSGFYEVAFRLEQYCATLKAMRKGIDLRVDVYVHAEDEKDRIVGSLNTVADLPVILQQGAITGETGLGKTTSLHQIEHRWAIPHLEAVGKSIDTYLPLYISLLPDSQFDLLKQIERTLSSDMFTRIDAGSKGYQLACHTLVSRLKSFSSLQQLFFSPILLLLDNADTLPVLSQAKLKEDIDKLRSSSLQGDILMAFREEVITQFQHLSRAQLQALNEKQVKELLRSRSDMRIHSLLHQSTRPISFYIRNPLLLDMIRDLGLTVDDMYDAGLNDLLERYVNRARSQLPQRYAKRIVDEWLPEIARHDLLESRYARVSKDRDLSEFILLASKVGLLVANFAGNANFVEFQFGYLRDYFLARYITNDIRRRGVETALTAFIQDIQQFEQQVLGWEAVFKMLVKQIDKKDINTYIEFLSGKKNEPGLAHICLLEFGSDAPDVPRPPALQLLQSIEDRSIPIDKRIAAARILGNLDPRIPSVEQLQSALVKVLPSERMTGFRIAKFPVTNMEFARFVQAQGYQKQEYWAERGWDWLQHNKIQFPLCWSHRELNRPNYPVVGVNFFEAKAYCAWLSKHLQANFDLPSVRQWDRAAHGSEKHFELLLELFRETSQKGKVPDKSIIQKQIVQRKWVKSIKMNRYESNDVAENHKELDKGVEKELIDELISIASTALQSYQEHMGYAMPIPIGMFPGNAIGCHDFYGSIWEWTKTVFSHVDDYFRDVLTSAPVYPGESACVKGGATGAISNAVWTLQGGWFDPSVRFHKLGFRIVSIENLGRF